MGSIGLDVHPFTSTFCILDENGKVVKIVTMRGGWKKLLAALRKIKRPFVICYEASCGYGALYDALRKIARRVVVAHPGQLRLIFRSKNKNDRSDAKKLATLSLLDQGPSTVRKRLTEAAWQGIRHCSDLKAYFERIRGDGVKRRKIAWVATAHYRVRVMHARLRTCETCRWETVSHQAA